MHFSRQTIIKKSTQGISYFQIYVNHQDLSKLVILVYKRVSTRSI